MNDPGEPVYTASTVSKVEPAVSIVTWPPVPLNVHHAVKPNGTSNVSCVSSSVTVHGSSGASALAPVTTRFVLPSLAAIAPFGVSLASGPGFGPAGRTACSNSCCCAAKQWSPSMGSD